MDDFLAGLLKTGTDAVGNLANSAILGRDEAARIAAARENLAWDQVNGSGPVDRAGYAQQASGGTVPNAKGGGVSLPLVIGVAVVAVVAVLIMRK